VVKVGLIGTGVDVQNNYLNAVLESRLKGRKIGRGKLSL
jgi:hypothetical protein